MVETRDIHRIFLDRGYVWKIDGEYKIPTEGDIAQALERMKQDLLDQDNLSMHFMGRLVVKKEADNYDVYVHLGRL